MKKMQKNNGHQPTNNRGFQPVIKPNGGFQPTTGGGKQPSPPKIPTPTPKK